MTKPEYSSAVDGPGCTQNTHEYHLQEQLAAFQEATKDAAEKRAELEQELSIVLSDWNDLVSAIGSRSHGGAVGHAKQVVAENQRLRELLRECIHELMPDAYELRDKIDNAIGRTGE